MGYLSIDFRYRDIRFLETDGSVKNMKVKKFNVLNTHREGNDIFEDDVSFKTVNEALGKVLSKGKFTKEPAGMSVASQYCFFRDIELPFKNSDQIRKVIKFEVENLVQIDIDDIVISYFKKTETLDKSLLLVVGAKKSVLLRQLELLDGRDVDPHFVDLDSLCIYNALAATGFLKEHERFIVVNVGGDSTDILIMNRGQLVSTRSIPMGVAPICRALEQDLKIARIPLDESVESAIGVSCLEEFTIHAGEVEESELLESEGESPLARAAGPAQPEEAKKHIEKRQKEFCTRLRRETLRSLTLMNEDDKPDTIFITGSGCTMPGVKELITELFNLEIEELDLMSKVDHSFPEEQVDIINREIAVPLGAAYKSVGFDITKVDLRQEDVRYAKKFDQVKVPLACLVFLFLILIVLLNLEKYMLRKAKGEEMNYIEQYAVQSLGMALGDKDEATKFAASQEIGFYRINRIKSAMKRKKEELGNLLGREGSIPELPSVLPAWNAFFSWIEENHKRFEYFNLRMLRIRMEEGRPSSTITFDCEVKSGADESLLADSMKDEVSMYSNVIASKSEPKGNYRLLKGWKIEVDTNKEVVKR